MENFNEKINTKIEQNFWLTNYNICPGNEAFVIVDNTLKLLPFGTSYKDRNLINAWIETFIDT